MESIKRLSEREARRAYFGMRERFAGIEMCKHMNWNITGFSDELGFEPWDINFIGTGPDAGMNVCEIKVREHYSSDFPDWILEKRKWEDIANISNIVSSLRTKRKYVHILYDMIVVWDLDKVKKEDFIIEYLASETIYGTNNKKDKEVAKLLIEKGMIIDYKLDYTKLASDAKAAFTWRYPHNTKDIINIHKYEDNN